MSKFEKNMKSISKPQRSGLVPLRWCKHKYRNNYSLYNYNVYDTVKLCEWNINIIINSGHVLYAYQT